MAVYFGPGMRFQRSQANGYFNRLEDVELIKEDVMQLLLTPKGARVRQPEFGSDLPLLKFEPNDAILRGLAATFIQEAIETWEDRVTYKGVDIVQEEHVFRFVVHIQYRFNRELDKVMVTLKRAA